ncbi:arylsulfatase [Catalinimonas alkaloidigena]|uniref:Arylsulfatase n=1 Tax=Catalinimonas alkaloidigena TaxID=1075417 RepID=A0A1G9AKZ1_9BACT|nr:arylsulfatase [Catalinimonas alkaloidigena]SDK28012.1 arylsulfatase [Catalinimonas alkaloidigena]
MRLLLPCFLLLTLLAACAPSDTTTHGATPPTRPNILIILADDMGYSDLGCYGSEIRTPHLDQLAAQGVKFRRFYNAARCCPTRASLLTGLYPHQAGMGKMVVDADTPREPGPYAGYLTPQSVTLAEALRDTGYATYMAGKWHVGEHPDFWPRRRGFDRYFGLISGASSYFELVDERPRVRYMVHDDSLWYPPDSGFYMTDAFTDSTINFLQTHLDEKPSQPFFCYLAYNAPHYPLHALPDDIARYEGVYNMGWDSLRAQRHRQQIASGLLDSTYLLSPRPDDLAAWADTTDQTEWARRMQVYAAMVDRMDQGIGKIVEMLRQHDALENTIIFFLSDNGGCAEDISGRNLHDPTVPIGLRGSYVAYREPWANASNTPYRRYKAWTNEGGAITPMIVHWPQGLTQTGVTLQGIGHVVDLMPTCLALAEASYPTVHHGETIPPMAGHDLLPILRGEDNSAHREIGWEHFGRKAYRQGKWKLVDELNGWELYDLEADPTELHNLATEQPERLQQMVDLYEAWAQKVGV